MSDGQARRRLQAERDRLRDTIRIVREQRDCLASDEPEDAPCGDGRCYCGGCVL